MGHWCTRRVCDGGAILNQANRDGSQFAAQHDLSGSRRSLARLGNEAEAGAPLENFKRRAGPAPDSPATEVANSSQSVLREKVQKIAQGPEKIALLMHVMRGSAAPQGRLGHARTPTLPRGPTSTVRSWTSDGAADRLISQWVGQLARQVPRYLSP